MQLRRIPIVEQLWQRIESLPPPKVEESIALRVLVQALVIVGMIATDVAAGTQMSLWAVPASVAGAVWSWYRRYDRNVALKFVLAIAMLVALAVFLRNLIDALNDTRVVLAQLLIWMQVLHSWDLPRRRDLGYSMAIGLILLGVAGTVSQTLAFAPLLLLFLALALPTLVLDYRSRLGLLNQKGDRNLWQTPDLSPKRLGVFLVVTVVLGLIVFAFMPRIPGYQLQTFPVSAPIDFQGNFDGRNIVNPGYEGEDGEGGGNGTGTQAEGAGELDDTFYYGFNDRINQNLRGEMKPQVVMRVRSQAKGFWRVMAFDRYTGQGWEVSRNEEVFELERSPWTFRFLLPPPRSSLPTREVIQTYTVISDLPNLIPALYQAHALYFPTRQIAVDPEGAMRSPVRLSDGLTYTVISKVPQRDRTQLRNASTDYSDKTREHYLQIPDDIRDRVRERTLEILEQPENPPTSIYEKAFYLAQHLKQHYQVPPDPRELPHLGEGEDLVLNFLFGCETAANPNTCTAGGYPDHFSTVLTVMLRSIGIPTRLVTGFAPGDFNPFTGLYVVRNTDAYAMTEVYFPDYGWFAFDPIPGRETIPPSIDESQTFGVLRQFWNWVAGWLPSPVTSGLGAIFGAISRIFSWLVEQFLRGWVGLFGGLITLIGFGFLGWLSWRGWKWWRYRRKLARLHPVERLYRQLLDWLAVQGFRKHPALTPLEYSRQMRSHHPPEVAEAIEAICQAYVLWRYGGEAMETESLEQQFERVRKGDRKMSYGQNRH